MGFFRRDCALRDAVNRVKAGFLFEQLESRAMAQAGVTLDAIDGWNIQLSYQDMTGATWLSVDRARIGDYDNWTTLQTNPGDSGEIDDFNPDASTSGVMPGLTYMYRLHGINAQGDDVDVLLGAYHTPGYGDNNGDSQVNQTDLDLLTTGMNGGGSGWLYGDYNDDGQIDFTDFGMLVNRYGSDGTQSNFSITSSAVFTPGQPYTLTLQTYDNADFYVIDWGDGTPNAPDQQFVTGDPYSSSANDSITNVTHTYANDGDYNISIGLGSALTRLNTPGITFGGFNIGGVYIKNKAVHTVAAPTNLTASTVDYSTVHLAWSNNATNANYLSVRSSTDGSNFTEIDQLSTSTASYDATGLNAGTKYWFEVCAVGAASTSDPATVSYSIVPQQPTALKTTLSGANAIKVSWTNASPNADSNTIQISSDGTNFTILGSVGGSVTNYTATGLDPNTRYYFDVTASNSYGDVGPSSVISSQITPDAPTDLTALTAASTEITLGWNNPTGSSATSNEILYSTDGENFDEFDDVSASTNQYVATDLDPATHYWFQIVSFNRYAQSEPSNTLDADPSAPDEVTAVAGQGGRVTVSWDSSSSSTSIYNIYASSDGGANFSYLGSAPGDQNSLDLYGLNPQVSYTFEVTVQNGAIESSPSAATEAITSPAVPTAPSNLSASVSQNSLLLNWSGDGSNTSEYAIYASTDGGSTFTIVGGADGADSSYVADGLEPGTAYTFQITAINASGESLPSDSLTQTAPTPIAVTVNVNQPATSVDINWTEDAEGFGYSVVRTPDANPSDAETIFQTSDPTATAYTDTGLDPTQSYTYTVSSLSGYADTALNSTQSPANSVSSPSSAAQLSPSEAESTGSTSNSRTSGSANTGSTKPEYFTATVDPTSNSVHLTWDYRGSASFELEELDPTNSGTNYYLIGTTQGRSADVGLTPGFNYQFRIRADHADGTVSDYVSTSVMILPQSPHDPGATLQKPNITGVTIDPIDWDDWRIVTAHVEDGDPNAGVSDYEVKYADDPYNVRDLSYEQSDASDWNPNGGFDEVLVVASVGERLMVRVQVSDGYQYSDWSDWAYFTPQPAVPFMNVPVPTPTLTAQPGADGSISLSWSGLTSDDTSVWDFGSLSIWRIDQNNPAPVLVPSTIYPWLQSSAEVPAGPTGSKFFITAFWGTNDGEEWGTTSYSNTVPADGETGGVPAAPGAISAKEDVNSDTQTTITINVAWENTPNNEDNFVLERSINGGGFTQLARLGSDETSYRDTLQTAWFSGGATPPTVEYRVMATNAAGDSSKTASEAVTLSWGGPDVTAHLAAIAADVDQQWNNLSFFAKARLVAGTITLFTAPEAWDVYDLAANQVETASLKNGGGRAEQTVTVNNRIHHQSAVNYFLAGLIYSKMNSDPLFTVYAHEFKLEVFAHTAWVKPLDWVAEKQEWFIAGTAEDPYHNVPQPNAFDGAIPAIQASGTLSWTWRFLGGSD